jgi:hypothetical protein
MRILAATILVLCASEPKALLAAENLLINGSFEVPRACNCHLAPGEDLGGWQIEGPVGFTVTPFWEYPYTKDGFQDLYLNVGGSIAQALPSKASYYELRGYAGASWNNGPTNLEIGTSNQIVGNIFVPAPRPPDFGPPFTWYEFQIEFFAQANEKLTLRALGPTVILDDLRLEEIPVPEPASVALVTMTFVAAVVSRSRKRS